MPSLYSRLGGCSHHCAYGPRASLAGCDRHDGQEASAGRNVCAGGCSRRSTGARRIPSAGRQKPGVVRVGIFMPQYEMGGPGGQSAGESVRTTEEQYLSGPKLEVVRIFALLPVQALAEAKEKNCDYVLSSSLSQKKSGGLGALKGLSAVAPMAYMVPGAGMAGMAVSQSLSIASTTAIVASSGVKAKSEVTLVYNLSSIDGVGVLKNTQKVKAKSDGEDVITPMIQKAATEVVGFLNK